MINKNQNTFLDKIPEKDKILLSILNLKNQGLISRSKYETIFKEIEKNSNFCDKLILSTLNIHQNTIENYEQSILKELQQIFSYKEVNYEKYSSSTNNLNSIHINDSQSSRESSPIGDSLLKSKIYTDIYKTKKPLKSFAFDLKRIE